MISMNIYEYAAFADEVKVSGLLGRLFGRAKEHAKETARKAGQSTAEGAVEGAVETAGRHSKQIEDMARNAGRAAAEGAAGAAKEHAEGIGSAAGKGIAQHAPEVGRSMGQGLGEHLSQSGGKALDSAVEKLREYSKNKKVRAGGAALGAAYAGSKVYGAYKQRERDKRMEDIASSLRALAGGNSKSASRMGIIGEAVTDPVRQVLMRGLMKYRPDAVDKQISDTLISRAPKHLKFTKVPTEMSHFNPFTKTVAHGDDAAVLAHELGHAEIDQSTLGKLVQNPVTILAGRLGSPALGLYGAGSGYVDASKGKKGKKGKEEGMSANKKALIGGALSMGPMLGYEGGASLIGMKRIREALKSNPNASKYLSSAGGRLARAFGTYATLPVAGAINYGIGRRVGGMLGSDE